MIERGEGPPIIPAPLELDALKAHSLSKIPTLERYRAIYPATLPYAADIVGHLQQFPHEPLERSYPVARIPDQLPTDEVTRGDVAEFMYALTHSVIDLSHAVGTPVLFRRGADGDRTQSMASSPEMVLEHLDYSWISKLIPHAPLKIMDERLQDWVKYRKSVERRREHPHLARLRSAPTPPNTDAVWKLLYSQSQVSRQHLIHNFSAIGS